MRKLFDGIAGGNRGAVRTALATAFLVAGLGFIAGGTDNQIPVAFIVAVVGAFCGLLFIRSRSRVEDVQFLCAIFLLGITLRCIIALVNHYLLPAGSFALDDGRYNEVGQQLVSYWKGTGGYPVYIAHSDQVGWFYVNGAIYWLWGFVPLVPAFLNCVIGPLCSLYVFYLCREVFDRPTAVWASLFAMFFPSLMLWSSINLKDALTTFAIVMVLWHTLMLQRHMSLGRFAVLLGFMTLLGTLRSYLFVLTGVSLVGSLMLGRLGVSFRGLALALLLMLGFVGLYQEYGFGSDIVENQGLATVNEMREGMASGGSAYGMEHEIASPIAAIAYLPIGLSYFLLAPAPWQIFNLRQALTFPEMLLWYCLLPAIWQGIRYALRTNFRAAATLLSFATVLTVAYAMVETNLGTAYRHRA
ncbi:MAG: glycosyltransferase family 39 protein, partial [Deltaproteobacteria bacterium]|nr:glycosyltransferase family 39 protein [Deltaproteobacteria bacterium]